MKIKTNFSVPLMRWILVLAVSLWSLALGLSGLAVWFVYDLRGIERDIPVLEKRLEELNRKSRGSAKVSSLPSERALTRIRKRLAAINALPGRVGWTPTTLFRKIEEMLPDKAYLISIHYKQKDGELLLVAESESQKPLTRFLSNLEGEPHFAEVLLTKQSQLKSRKKHLIRYEMRIRERLS